MKAKRLRIAAFVALLVFVVLLAAYVLSARIYMGSAKSPPSPPRGR